MALIGKQFFDTFYDFDHHHQRSHSMVYNFYRLGTTFINFEANRIEVNVVDHFFDPPSTPFLGHRSIRPPSTFFLGQKTSKNDPPKKGQF